MKTNTLVLVSISLLIGMLVGCHRNVAPYEIEVINETGLSMDGVVVDCDRFVCTMGIIPPDKHKSYGTFIQEPSEEVNISWVDPTRTPHTNRVSVVNIYDHRQYGRLTFNVGSNKTCVSFR